MAQSKEPSEVALRNQDIEPYITTDIYTTETTHTYDDPHKLSKIRGSDIELKPSKPHRIINKTIPSEATAQKRD